MRSKFEIKDNRTFAEKTKLTFDHRVAGIIFAAVALKLKQSFLVVIIGAAAVSAIIYRLHSQLLKDRQALELCFEIVI